MSSFLVITVQVGFFCNEELGIPTHGTTSKEHDTRTIMAVKLW